MSDAEWIDGDGRTRLVGQLVGGSSGGPPTGPAGGDLAGTYPDPQIANGSVTYADLNANVKPSGTALPADEALRALGTNADTACAGNDSRLSDSRTPTGTAGGDLTGNYPNPTIAAGKVAAAQISSTLKPSGSATPSTEALRALGTTSDTACAGNDSRLNESLDQIASAHATTADWSNNSHKITSLANGSASSDAAAFGQIPTALPPNGSAGGNLTGTYPNPTIADVALLTTKGDLLGRGTSAPAARLAVGSDGQVLTADAASTLGVKWATPSGGGASYACVQDQKTQNTAGGTFTSGAWRTRTLNTVQSDPSSIVSLSSNQITLQAGTYLFWASAPAFFVDHHQARLQNITDSTTAIVGTGEYQPTGLGNDPVTRSIVSGIVVIAGAKAFEVQHICGTTRSTDGFGNAANLTTEVYTVVQITKIA